MSENLKEQLALREREEELLRFSKFSNEDALTLGMTVIEIAREWGVNVTLDIEINGVQLFHYAMPGSNQRHAMWVRRKQNTVKVCQMSTLHAGQWLEDAGKDLWKDWRLPEADYAILGGGFPIHVAGTGIIGAIACSALPHQEDHRLLCTAISRMLGVDLPA